MLSEASDEATRVREEADIEAARRRADAAADAEAELSMAKQQGREMVNEARAYRERVLSELARRRELAREQIEQLIHGRDRLMQAFERARLVAVDVVAEMQPLGEPDEYVNLSPTTGPLPVMIANSPRPVDTVVAVPAVSAADVDAPDAADDAAEQTVDVELRIVENDADEMVDDDVAVDDLSVDDEPDDMDEVAPDVDMSDHVESDPDAGDAGDDGDVVVDLFARLRADTVRSDDATTSDISVWPAVVIAPAEIDVDDVIDADTDEAEPTPFERRDEVITPLIVSSARKLKRALADEQNDVLDALRRSDAVHSLDALLPAPAAHAARYAEAIADDLTDAVHEGSAASRLGGRKIRKAVATEAVGVANEALLQWLVMPLRDRLARCIADSDGDNAVVTKKVRAVYREWKTQHIDETLDDVIRCAHGRGVLAGFDADTPIVWEVDSRFAACPDCDDNALAGAVAAGMQFPTGDSFAPAHPGCRCLLVAADR